MSICLQAMMAAALFGSMSHAQPITLDDLAGTDNYALRLQSGTGYLGASGDFDGDGSRDIARFEREGDTVYLVVHAPGDGSGRRHILRDFLVDDMDLYGVEAAPAGTYATSCERGSGDRGLSCLIDKVAVTTDALQFITFDKSVRLFYWDRGGFSSVYISEGPGL